MRDLTELEQFRVTTRFHGNSSGNPLMGTFILRSPTDRKELRIIASAAVGWDHVSVSRDTRIPNWLEMSFIHRQFFLPDEVAMQLHVPQSDHVNDHERCLHLWRPHDAIIPCPPKWLVGGMKMADACMAYEEW